MAEHHRPSFHHDLAEGRDPWADPASAAPSQRAEALVRRVEVEPLSDGGLRSAHLLEQALACDPTHHQARLLRERLYQMFVPRWHFPMLADSLRNTAYARAIAAKVRPGDVVLDIGCGAGLTAMLAARAGARHVYTCEQQPLIAEAATQVIAQNGLSDRITVIAKPSHELVVGVDLPVPADVVISEIVDTVLLGEGALATLNHAMRRLARPDARAVPERGTLMAQVVESDGLMDLWRPRQAEGFDLSAFHRFASVAQLTPSDFAACRLRPLSAATDLFAFDFARPVVAPGRVSERLTCSSAGIAHAVFVSFEMELAPDIVIGNGLYSAGHWGRTAFLLDRPRALARGDTLQITAQHDTAQLSLAVQDMGAEAGDIVAGQDLPWHQGSVEAAGHGRAPRPA